MKRATSIVTREPFVVQTFIPVFDPWTSFGLNDIKNGTAIYFQNSTFLTIINNNPVVIIALSEVFAGTVPSNDPFPFPLNPYLKTDRTSLLILFLLKNFEEK